MKFLTKQFFLLYFLVTFTLTFAQNSEKENSSQYLTIDLSKSHPTNRTLDHLYYLTTNSISVELPSEVLEFLESIPDGYDMSVHAKYTYQRSEVLKVLYNERISPEDKQFICNYYLQIDTEGITPIQPILQKYINEGSL